MSFATEVILVAVLLAGAWWLSGYDSRVTGENKTEDLIRRVIRCVITRLLILLTTLNPYFAIFIFLALAVLWASSIAELFTHRLHNVVDLMTPGNLIRRKWSATWICRGILMKIL